MDYTSEQIAALERAEWEDKALKYGKPVGSKMICPKIKTCKVTPHNCACDMRENCRC